MQHHVAAYADLLRFVQYHSFAAANSVPTGAECLQKMPSTQIHPTQIAKHLSYLDLLEVVAYIMCLQDYIACQRTWGLPLIVRPDRALASK